MHTALRSTVALIVLVASVTAIAGPASAADKTARITGGSVSGATDTGTKAVFTAGGTHIDCTSHTSTATTNGTASMSTNANAYAGCTVRETGNSVSITVTNTAACKWTYTASTLTDLTITIPANCVSMSITLFGGNVCTITIGAATIPATWTNSTHKEKQGPNHTMPFVSSGFPCPASGNATFEETMVFASASITSGAP